ncbi:Flp/Fap pilin component [Brevundimonas sp. SH203]|uniref:Flp family type IVb pilin n=1 Tax=Brevundimonas sp. SH203 TaxID=345167 RepID=UPI0009C902F8|nr:Flp family type IVb pilin [Brevundimonas sp. SH203]GAW42368.1 Flp/Fap pilin component [Brevundimonas sp. SH203]
MRRLTGRFLRDESGATAIEYGLICALIFLAIVGSVGAMANSHNGGLAATADKISTAIKATIG